MEIRYETVNPVPRMHGNSIPVGTVFTGMIMFTGMINEPSVYLRTFCGIVDLQNPRMTWSFNDAPTVTNYLPRKATVLVEGGPDPSIGA